MTNRNAVARMALVVGVAWALATGQAPAEAPPVVARFDDGRLSVSATDTPIEDVVREVARVAGIEVKGAAPKPRQVTIALENVPLEDALRRLFGEQPFSLRYQGDRLSEIALVDVGSPAARSPVRAAPGIALPNGDHYFPPPEARVVRNPTAAQLEAARVEFEAAQHPLEVPTVPQAAEQ